MPRNLDEEKSIMKWPVVFSRGSALLLPAVLFVALAANLTAQEPKPAAATPPPAVSHRVPSYFGQVELTADQRSKIYALQDVQQPVIDRLKQQLEAARVKLLADSEAVLTSSQRERLATLRSSAKAKSLARSQARAKAKQATQASAANKAG
jgi:Spy/CpxP family protein refolding chaperone